MAHAQPELEIRPELEVRVGALHGPRLLQDYVSGAAAARPFFNGNPFSLAAYERKAREVDTRFDAAARARMAEAITPSSEGARRHLAAVIEQGGYFVTTGQQAGAFGGPLYTIYKILSAIRLARALEARLGRPVAPLFWVASEDHDWAEANHALVVDPTHTLRRIELPSPADTPPVSMARRALGPGLDSTLARLGEALADTTFRRPLLEQIRGCYRDGRSVAESFTELIRAWFAPYDLLVTHAADPALKRISRPVLAREVAEAAASEAAVRRQTERLEAAGYDAQVPILERALNLFYEGDAGRERIEREDAGFRARAAGRRWTSEALVAEIEAAPHAFSPNVLLRPVVESAVFPTLAYVGGPAEVAYHAQLACLFRLHGVGMPVVVPRGSALLVEPKVRKALDKLRLQPAELAAPPHELAQRIARDALPDDVARQLAGLRRTLLAGFDALAASAVRIDPTLDGPIRSAGHAALHEVERAEKKILRRLKAKNEVLLRQAEKARTHLFPGGAPQERSLNITQYLARYGPGVLDALHDAFEPAVGDAADWGKEDCGGG